MFASDLTTFLHMLKETRANCIVATAGTNAEGPWQAQLALTEGYVTFCQIRSSADGQTLFADDAALHWLTKRGNLPWEQLTTQPQQSLLPSPRVSQASLHQSDAVPQRLTPLEGRGMISWSRKHRQVFGLIDGQRSIARIALLLRQPLNVVEDIIHDLQSRGAIAVTSLLHDVEVEERVV